MRILKKKLVRITELLTFGGVFFLFFFFLTSQYFGSLRFYISPSTRGSCDDDVAESISTPLRLSESSPISVLRKSLVCYFRQPALRPKFVL